MIISRTPPRVSFAGGGTDIRDYYITVGAVVSSAIEECVSVTVNGRLDHDIRGSYSKTEIADSVGKIEHGAVREALRKDGTRNETEIATITDLPSRGTGLTRHLPSPSAS
jgi:D-glycero-alpha-D-manno-heptose-7-phosphate kinase